MTRALPLVLVLLAGAADAGDHRLAFYVLLAAIPAGAAAALAAFGDVVDGRAGLVRFALPLGALALLVLGAAVRAPALHDASLPALAVSAPLGAAALYAVQGVVALAALGTSAQRDATAA